MKLKNLFFLKFPIPRPPRCQRVNRVEPFNNTIWHSLYFFDYIFYIAIDHIFSRKWFKGIFLKYLIIYLNLSILRNSRYLLFYREFNSLLFFFISYIITFAIPIFAEKKLSLLRTFKKYWKKSAPKPFWRRFFFWPSRNFLADREFMSVWPTFTS